jgi:hypothetical protein
MATSVVPKWSKPFSLQSNIAYALDRSNASAPTRVIQPQSSIFR